MNKDFLFGKSLNSLISITKEFGLPGFTAHQIADWLYKRRVVSIDEMTNLSKKARTLLNEKYELGLFPPLKESISVDGTIKYLFKVLDNKYIETLVFSITEIRK